MRILVVDDDHDAGDSLAELLSVMNHECVVVRDGEQALDMDPSQRFDAILMDLKLPGISGLEASRQLMHREPSSKVIIMTGNCVEEELEAARHLPIVDLLRKPFRTAELVHALAACARLHDPHGRP